MQSIDLPPEKKVDNYEWNWKSHLGSGAFGKVYLAKNAKDPTQLVAIKIIETSLLDDEEMKKSLNNEIEIMKQLKSPNIVSFYNVFFTKNNVYIITEFCNGGDLRGLFKREKGPMPEEKAKIILKDIVIGFKELVNLKIIHRDLKPENIMIHDKVFKLGDFGFSKHVSNYKNQMLTSLVGTPLYMSPQILKQDHYTTKCDIWSLGLIFYEMLYGKTPWPARSQYELVMNITNIPLKFPYNITISDTSKDFIRKCLEIEEEKRISWEQLFEHKIFKESSSKTSLYEKPGSDLSTLDTTSKEIIQKIQKVLQEKKISAEELFKQENIKCLNVGKFVEIMKKFVLECKKDELEFIFFKFDANQDNAMSLSEFKQLICENDYSPYSIYQDPFLEEKANKIINILSQAIQKKKLDIDTVFKVFDKKKNSKLIFADFQDLLRTINKEITEKESEYVFNKIDENKVGFISKQDFRNLIEKSLLISERENKTKKLMDEKAYATINTLREIILKKTIDINRIFQNFDSNKRGIIEITKFHEMMTIINPKLKKEETKYIFDIFDLDRNGSIDIHEFEKILMK